MQAPVSPIEYKAALHVVEKITPVLSILKHLDKQALGYDEEAWAETEEFVHLLDQILTKNQTVIDGGIAQYDNRPLALIDAAVARLHQIPTLIEKAEKSLRHKVDARNSQREELEKQHLSEAQIDYVAPLVSRDEIDKTHVVVVSLKAEAESIKQFLADAPRYDMGLLAGTQLEQFIPGNAA
jgi:hypothetical protein